MLQARFYGWAQGTPTEPARVGPAGEKVVHASFREAAPVAGYRLFNPTTGQVSSVAEVSIKGAFDNGGMLTLYNDLQRPTGSVAVVVEVKNIRDWLYPNSHEVYQLLSKAALLTTSLGPDLPVLPLLICRKAHYSLRVMARAFGFLVHDTSSQFIMPLPSDIDPRYLIELRTELEYNSCGQLSTGVVECPHGGWASPEQSH